MSTNTEAVVVTGATGKQGSSVVRALAALASPPPIHAITRTPTSAAALALAALPSVTLHAGDLAKPAEIVTASLPPSVTASPWSLYVVSLPGGPEVAQATALIDAGLATGTLRHIVLSSVARSGGPYGKKVQHWETKIAIEEHLIKACEQQQQQQQQSASSTTKTTTKTTTTYTIIRPVFLLDNLSLPGLFGTMSTSIWADFIEPRPLQVVDPADIGRVAARALADRASRLYGACRAVTLCGEELTFAQAEGIFKQRTGGQAWPKANRFLVKLLLLMMRDFGRMVEANAKEGFGASVGCKELEGEMVLNDFGQWLDESRFVKKE